MAEAVYALTVYATGSFGNTASETIQFTITNPTKTVIIYALAITAIVAIRHTNAENILCSLTAGAQNKIVSLETPKGVCIQ